MRLPLLGGSYSPRSVIASCTRAVNLYPEINPKGTSLVPMTHYQRPGFRFVVSDPPVQAPVRQIYSRSDGNGGYVVIGNVVYSISNDLVLTVIGELQTTTGWVSIIDNGVTAFFVDGTPNGGFFADLTTNDFSQIVDPTGSFTGGTSVDTLDTFLLWGFLNSNFYGATLAGSNSFNALYYAAKAAYPDPLLRLIVNKREILLLGLKRSEIWYNAGNAQFPFALLPGIYIQHGIVAPASAAYQNIEVYWLSTNEQGQGIVLMQRGYETRRISNHALEYQIRQMASTGIISDAIGFTYQLDGHPFYVLTFPTGDQTWVYDASNADPGTAWHQWAWTDSSGGLHACRANCGAWFPNATLAAVDSRVGCFLVGDWQNGAIYVLDPNYYFDDALESLEAPGANPANSPAPISWIRTFHHIGQGRGQGTYQLGEADGRRVKHNYFMADIDAGQVPLSADGQPQITLRYSDDRGNTWNNGILLPYGPQGDYATWPTWRVLGLARDRVYEVWFSTGGKTALNGAWVDAEILDS